MDNPLLDAYEAVWDMLEADSDFLAMFPSDGVHQVRYDTALDYAPEPELHTPAEGDYPI